MFFFQTMWYDQKRLWDIKRIQFAFELIVWNGSGVNVVLCLYKIFGFETSGMPKHLFISKYAFFVFWKTCLEINSGRAFSESEFRFLLWFFSSSSFWSFFAVRYFLTKHIRSLQCCSANKNRKRLLFNPQYSTIKHCDEVGPMSMVFLISFHLIEFKCAHNFKHIHIYE